VDRLYRRKEVNEVWGLLLLGGYYPFYRAWLGAAGTTLRHAITWGSLAWTAWCAAALLGNSEPVRYLALCLTACAGVAVLGARRPGAAAWNFVVAGLLAALCRPLLEGLGELRLERGHVIFLAVALAVGLLNYLPTRQALCVVVLGAWSALELAGVRLPALFVMLALAPWLGLFCAPRRIENDFDSSWRFYRDCFGFVWAQRLRDQFNRAAENAGWPVTLGWSGLRQSGAGEMPPEERLLATLRALLTRFRTDPPV
jgi:hypothetical protein